MSNKFDELAKGLAQSVTRRGALKKFGLGLAGVVFAFLGMATKAEAGTGGATNRCINKCKSDCKKIYKVGTPEWEICWTSCAGNCPSGV
jgi:hypothetical protein